MVVCGRKQIFNHIQDGDDVIEFMRALKEPVNPKLVDYFTNFDPIDKVVKDPIKVNPEVVNDTSILHDG